MARSSRRRGRLHHRRPGRDEGTGTCSRSYCAQEMDSSSLRGLLIMRATSARKPGRCCRRMSSRQASRSRRSWSHPFSDRACYRMAYANAICDHKGDRELEYLFSRLSRQFYVLKGEHPMTELEKGQLDMKLRSRAARRFRRRPRQGVLRESRLAARHRHRGERLPRRADDAAQLGSLDHLRQGNHVGQARLSATAWSSPSTTSTPPATTWSPAAST